MADFRARASTKAVAFKVLPKAGELSNYCQESRPPLHQSPLFQKLCRILGSGRNLWETVGHAVIDNCQAGAIPDDSNKRDVIANARPFLPNSKP